MTPVSAPDAGPRSAPIWIARSTTSCARPLASYATTCTTAGPDGRGSGSGNVMMKVRPRAPVAIPRSGHRPARAHDDGLGAPRLEHDLDAPRRLAHVPADDQVAGGDDLVGSGRRGHGDVGEGGIERRDAPAAATPRWTAGDGPALTERRSAPSRRHRRHRPRPRPRPTTSPRPHAAIANRPRPRPPARPDRRPSPGTVSQLMSMKTFLVSV